MNRGGEASPVSFSFSLSWTDCCWGVIVAMIWISTFYPPLPMGGTLVLFRGHEALPRDTLGRQRPDCRCVTQSLSSSSHYYHHHHQQLLAKKLRKPDERVKSGIVRHKDRHTGVSKGSCGNGRQIWGANTISFRKCQANYCSPRCWRIDFKWLTAARQGYECKCWRPAIQVDHRGRRGKKAPSRNICLALPPLPPRTIKPINLPPCYGHTHTGCVRRHESHIATSPY